MQKYPLSIVACAEFEGGSKTISFFSKGHHDKKDFLENLEKEHNYHTKGHETFFRSNGKVIPGPNGGVWIKFFTKPCRGSFPVTVLNID